MNELCIVITAAWLNASQKLRSDGVLTGRCETIQSVRKIETVLFENVTCPCVVTDDDVCENGNRNTEKKPSLSSVPETELLDTSASKEKTYLVASGPMASRRLPTRRGSGVSHSS